MNRLSLIEGSYVYHAVNSELNISEDYILMKLSSQYEYRPTEESLWAELITPKFVARYVLDYPNKLVNRVYYKEII